MFILLFQGPPTAAPRTSNNVQTQSNFTRQNTFDTSAGNSRHATDATPAYNPSPLDSTSESGLKKNFLPGVG
jgi:hypothetical protein